MTRTIAPIAALLLSVALLLTGNGLQGTLLPVRANLEAFTEFDIGILGSAYFLGFAIGCLYGPYVVRRSGHIRTFTAMVAIASCVALVHALVVESAVWWVLRGMTGFCFAVLYMVIESWLNEKATNENRGLVFSIYTIINLTVITVGQMMLLLYAPTEFPLFALASILVSLAAVPVALTRAEAPAPVTAVRIRLRRLYRLSPVGFVGCLAVGLANGSFWALAPIFAQNAMGDVAGVALFMSVAVIGGAVGQWPLGHLSDRMDRRKVIVAVAIGAVVTGLGMVAAAEAWNRGILAIAFFFGLFAFPLYALSVAHMNDYVDPQGYVEAAGGLLLIFAMGAVIGPIIASAVTRYFGVEWLFAYTAAIHLLTALFALYRMKRRPPAPEEEHVPFGDAIRMAQTVANIDELAPDAGQPRADEPQPPAATTGDDAGPPPEDRPGSG